MNDCSSYAFIAVRVRKSKNVKKIEAAETFCECSLQDGRYKIKKQRHI
jgi:hypothetical protein